MKSEKSESKPDRDALTQQCQECGKWITDDEWVVNWCSCAECFDRHYEEYLRDNPLPEVGAQFGDVFDAD